MKQKLPKTTVETLALFPRNLRLITDYTFSKKQSHNIKIALVSIFSLFLLAVITLQSIVIRDNFLLRESFSQQHAQLQNEVTYWKNLADKYKGDRDLDYRIAALQFKLGNISESQDYVKKALELDPNYPEGKVLGAQVGL